MPLRRDLEDDSLGPDRAGVVEPPPVFHAEGVNVLAGLGAGDGFDNPAAHLGVDIRVGRIPASISSSSLFKTERNRGRAYGTARSAFLRQRRSELDGAPLPW